MTSDTSDDPATSRLDNFVDAAFAFALTLLVIGESAARPSYAQLLEALYQIPGFVASFALIGLFWFAHVQWRRAGGANDRVSIMLSLALVLTVLVYVYPMRLMVGALVDFISGKEMHDLSLRGLFTIYGFGFTVMTALISGLFAQCRRAGQLRPGHNDAALVWFVMSCTGVLSVLLAQFEPTLLVAPWAYALLPISIPLAIRTRRVTTAN